MIVYLAGPIRGMKEFNSPAFDAAQAKLEAMGHIVLSPVEMDRQNNFYPGSHDQHDCAQRDLDAIFKSDWVVTLPGCETSVGATAEIAVAKWLRKPVYLLSEIL
jgi:nucleoside 2-deoxyribosyltransferase